MPITIQELIDEITPDNTVLILGSGASIPSGGPSAADLIRFIGDEFKIDPSGLNLREISGLAEKKRSRRDLIGAVRSRFERLRAKGALLNVPLYTWKSIFSTNYDKFLEDAYKRAGRSLTVFTSNFNFTVQTDPTATKLFKIHGTIDKDIIDGDASRIILTDVDYDATQEYREALYTRLQSDMSPGTQVLIVGQSLADQDLRDVIQQAISINKNAMAGGRITLLLYERDDNRAQLFENRGLRVVFSDLDSFVIALAKKTPDHVPITSDTGSPIDNVTSLRPVTHDVSEEVDPGRANASAIFNGWPATYADVVRGLTFDRTVAGEISQFLQNEAHLCAVLLGASGVGKTTAGRQTLLKMRSRGFMAWEHKHDHPLSPRNWLSVAQQLKANGHYGILFIDDAHTHLYEINDLVDLLIAEGHSALKILAVSARNHWGPRIKTPNIYVRGNEFHLSKLNSQEIDRLLTLLESTRELRTLVEAGFSGFSQNEKRRRLADRCEADMFVCLKNIFASEKFDDIILREYTTLTKESQDAYRFIAAMEYAGVRVHRQLVVRILGIPADTIAAVLSSLEDIVSEYEVNAREGIYGWRVRHYVIAGIISHYKFFELDKRIDLFRKVIDNISPTYDIEIRTIRDLCNLETGIANIPDKSVQNVLLRRMMSIAPGERIPRHRLIRNLIDLGEFEQAESEIRIFETDFKKEATITRYRILLMVARATDTPGLMKEDRLVIMEQARDFAVGAIRRYGENKYLLGTYCEIGVEWFKITGSMDVFDDAMAVIKKAETRLGDPDITRIAIKYQRRLSGQNASAPELGNTLAEIEEHLDE